jgi:hypothetical protein
MNRRPAPRTLAVVIVTVMLLALSGAPAALAERPVQIDAGNGFTCAVIDTGRIRCWGYNSDGQLGDGTFDDKSVPVPVVGIRDGVMVSTRSYHACAVTSGGAAATSATGPPTPAPFPCRSPGSATR